MNVVEFIHAAKRRAKSLGKLDRVALIDEAMPIVVPGQYVSGSSPDPVDHSGTCLPFRAALFFCRWPDSVWSTATLLYETPPWDLDWSKRYIKELFLSRDPNGITGASNFSPTEDLASADRIIACRNFVSVEENILLHSMSYWFAKKDWTWLATRLTGCSDYATHYATLIPDLCSSAALAAMDLLSCKNVGMVDEVEKISRQRTRRGVSGVTFKTIVVTGSAHVSKNGSEKAIPLSSLPKLHECRAHFKEYGEERPLFGKLTGRWFWHQHLRGDARSGVVVHDKYEVRN